MKWRSSYEYCKPAVQISLDGPYHCFGDGSHLAGRLPTATAASTAIAPAEFGRPAIAPAKFGHPTIDRTSASATQSHTFPHSDPHYPVSSLAAGPDQHPASPLPVLLWR